MRELYTERYPGGPILLDGAEECPGARFYANSVTGTDGAGYGRSPRKPCASMAYALANFATADAFDQIVAMPGHVETIAAAGSLAASKAGVEFLGLGRGSKQPKITFAGTDSVVAVSAANVTFRNFAIALTIDEVVSAFSVTGAFCQLIDVDYVEDTSYQLIQFLLCAAGATDLLVRRGKHHQTSVSASTQVWMDLAAAHRVTIEDMILHLTLKNAAGSFAIGTAGTAPAGVTIRRNSIVQLGGTTQTKAVSLPSGSTGVCHDNRVSAAVTTLAGTFAVPTTVYCHENYVSHTGNKNGILDPVVDS